MMAVRDARGSGMLLALAAALTLPTPSANALAQARPTESRPASQAKKPPNILFVLVDDMGLADLGFMGGKTPTPRLDRLAHDGVVLTRFYDGAPICSPSRAAFFTGRFPAEVGFYSFINDRSSNAAVGQANWLDPRLPNVATILRSAGYATAHFGKWHMGGGRDVGDAPWPTAYGFDESFTTFEGLGPRVLVADEERGLADQSARLGQGPFFYERKSELTQLYAHKTLDFVSRHRDAPWFVQLWLNDVHDPWAPDEGFLAATRGVGRDADESRYVATIAKMDRTLGNLVDRLADMGEAENTLIVVTSDNGPSALQRYYAGGASPPGSVDHLRGRKGSNYEGGIRQPLLLCWPGHVRAGYRDERTVASAVDLLPTLAAIVGARVPRGTAGIDLTPVLAGRPIARRPPLYWAFGNPRAARQPRGPYRPHDIAPPLALRDGKWKLLTRADGSGAELYDLDADPGETRDLAGREPRRRVALWQRLQAWSRRLPVP